MKYECKACAHKNNLDQDLPYCNKKKHHLLYYTDCFYIFLIFMVLFSALEQIYCVLVAFDSEWVTVALQIMHSA